MYQHNQDFGIYVTDNFILSPMNKSKFSDQIKSLALRFFEIVVALIGLILLSPLMLAIALAIKIGLKGQYFIVRKDY